MRLCLLGTEKMLEQPEFVFDNIFRINKASNIEKSTITSNKPPYKSRYLLKQGWNIHCGNKTKGCNPHRLYNTPSMLRLGLRF